MKFHILTLFPEMMEMVLKESIIGRAQQGILIEVEAINIRDYAHNKHRHVDDYPYGGGAGMLMQAAPICEAYEELSKKLGKRPKVLYMTPPYYHSNAAAEKAREIYRVSGALKKKKKQKKTLLADYRHHSKGAHEP